jgi:hypothetical protein
MKLSSRPYGFWIGQIMLKKTSGQARGIEEEDRYA